MKHRIRGNINLDTFAAWLDAKDADRLRADIEQMNRADMLRLWKLAERGPAIDLDHFAGPGLATAVHHAGRNSIPTLARWRRFEKRFARMHETSDTLVGYNEGELRRFIGPGYFVLRRSTTPQQISRGAVFVDYLSVPDGAVPQSWPPIQANEQGLQRFIYAGTQDFMRKVSSRVSVGMPYKGHKQLPYPFVLVRLGE